MRSFSICAVFAGCLAAGSSPALAREGYAATRYPVVLVHGMFGWDKMLGALDYFYNIPADLERAGAKVYIAKVSALESTEVRGEQLLAQIETILALSGAEKVNLIGHSHGVPTSRYVEAVRPDLVASITSVAGVHRGSPVADLFLGLVERDGLAGFAVEMLGNALGDLITKISGNQVRDRSDIASSLKALSSREAQTFNHRYPSGIAADACGSSAAQNDNGTFLFSYGGTKPFTNAIDAGDYLFYMIAKVAFGQEESDGLVGRCSSHFGYMIRDNYRWNHLDSMNHLFGLVGSDPLPIYRQAVNRLKTLEL